MEIFYKKSFKLCIFFLYRYIDRELNRLINFDSNKKYLN